MFLANESLRKNFFSLTTEVTKSTEVESDKVADSKQSANAITNGTSNGSDSIPDGDQVSSEERKSSLTNNIPPPPTSSPPQLPESAKVVENTATAVEEVSTVTGTSDAGTVSGAKSKRRKKTFGKKKKKEDAIDQIDVSKDIHAKVQGCK